MATWDTVVGTWAGETDAGLLGYKLISAPANSYQLQQLEVQNESTATNLLVTLERVGLPLGEKGESSTVKQVKGFFPIISGEVGIEILFWFGAQESTPEDPFDWEGPFSFIVGETDYLDPFVSGRFLAFKLQSQSSDNWVFQGYTLDVEEVGSF